MERSNQCFMLLMPSFFLLFKLLPYRLQIYLLRCGSWWPSIQMTTETMTPATSSMLHAVVGSPLRPSNKNLLATFVRSFLHQRGGFLANTSTPTCGLHDHDSNINTTPPPFLSAPKFVSLHHLYLPPRWRKATKIASGRDP